MLQKQTKGQGVELFKLELFLALPFEGERLSSSFALLPSVNPIPVFRLSLGVEVGEDASAA